MRRKTNEKMLEQCIIPSVKHGGGSVMVWWCFGGGKIGDLYKVEGSLRKESYHKIFQCHTIPRGQHLIGVSFKARHVLLKGKISLMYVCERESVEEITSIKLNKLNITSIY